MRSSSVVPAKATPVAGATANAESDHADRDLTHIRVGPPFASKLDRPCGCGCGATTKDKQAAIVENTRSGKKRAFLEACLQKPERAALLARREDTEDSFLA